MKQRISPPLPHRHLRPSTILTQSSADFLTKFSHHNLSAKYIALFRPSITFGPFPVFLLPFLSSSSYPFGSLSFSLLSFPFFSHVLSDLGPCGLASRSPWMTNSLVIAALHAQQAYRALTHLRLFPIIGPENPTWEQLRKIEAADIKC